MKLNKKTKAWINLNIFRSIEIPPQETVPTESSSTDVVVAPEVVELALAEPEVTSTDSFVVIEEPTATTETESK